MADKPPINLMIGLVDMGKNGKTKAAIQIESEDLLFNPNDAAMAASVADALLKQIQERLLKGQTPGGRPLPPITGKSSARRELEVAQAKRGGEASPRYTDKDFRADVRRNYRRDYTAAKLGTFTPHSGTIRGVVSGMLAHSFLARPNKSGKGVTIFVAAKRGRPRPSNTKRAPETKSALENVFGDIPFADHAMMQSPGVKNAMRVAAVKMFGKNMASVLKAAAELTVKLVREAAETASIAEDIAEDAE